MSCVDQTLKHLTAAQLPKSVCPSGILQLSIPGWCVGADVQNGLSKVGYMFFLRDDVDPGALKALRIKQQDDIVLPFLADNRKSKGWAPGTPVPPKLAATYFMDAEQNGIQAVTMADRAARLHDQHKLNVAM